MTSRSTTSISHRSRSAAPTDSPSQHYRSRSKSPTMISDRRSLSPPDYRYPGGVPSYRQGSSRFLTRSATATPTSTPKKRQLPQIPGTMPSSLDERIPYVSFIINIYDYVSYNVQLSNFYIIVF